MTPRHLRPVDDPRPSEVHVGALASHHVGLTILIRHRRNVITGPLMEVPTASLTKPLLVIQVGDFPVALHPTAIVTTVPNGCKATITLTPHTPEPRATAQRSNDGGVVGDAVNGERTMKLLPGRWRNRRKCYCGCGGKSSHGGYADGIAMMSGCEWATRYWVTHGRLPAPDTER